MSGAQGSELHRPGLKFHIAIYKLFDIGKLTSPLYPFFFFNMINNNTIFIKDLLGDNKTMHFKDSTEEKKAHVIYDYARR